ncbi:ArsR/SmtB family transcription factor [Anaerocellum danielii]|uniref:Metalloregulator ArsR/SmtB family transcription factor n=1 Tax=Anaerocellum danielii TaxID=1387557 RepID=A0ABZ0TWN5_9FIRM|nr:metalloregulator ArsR/SmtB family transcription factor [Caldicellulosiruptor danielii]WPX07868.1 metalloregulator ArsR/SmtB family transcription factor [Caldicellulosiruptor danielii]
MTSKEEIIAKIFKALSHPVRIRIVKLLLEEESKYVCELQEMVEFSQPNLSQHLRVLKDAQILEAEKIGLNVCYKLKNENVKNLFEAAKILADSILEELQHVKEENF